MKKKVSIQVAIDGVYRRFAAGEISDSQALTPPGESFFDEHKNVLKLIEEMAHRPPKQAMHYAIVQAGESNWDVPVSLKTYNRMVRAGESRPVAMQFSWSETKFKVAGVKKVVRGDETVIKFSHLSTSPGSIPSHHQ